MTEFAKPQDDSVHSAGLTLPFDDNFFTSESLQFNSDLFAADSNSADSGYAKAPLRPETQPEESFPLREWRRQNAARLADKEKTEKELLNQILNEADAYRVEFLENQQIKCENGKAINREKEKLFLIRKEKFDAEADKNYWKSIAELIPTETEVAGVEKRGRKVQEKKPSIDVVQGPKPGRRTNLSRMRQIHLKLKYDSPTHLKLSPPTSRMSSTCTAASDYEAPDAVIVA